ncbi:MAG: hypothetical protein O2950_01745 [Proteobacteria bacterium]|jgi:hypothetical protein|nr:hypothetical protein [Pseudomonadota bacterium]MDA1350995.1 hypothetical protein [Pseudomonadota bacterium]
MTQLVADQGVLWQNSRPLMRQGLTNLILTAKVVLYQNIFMREWRNW